MEADRHLKSAQQTWPKAHPKQAAWVEACGPHPPPQKFSKGVEPIHEEFGDGMMSAIDVKRDPAASPNGDRVDIVLSAKFLACKQY